MSERSRKCLICAISAAVDPDITLYRFPKPGTKNILRCEMWAKYCFPDGPWSSVGFQKNLYTAHKMLCHRHFKESSFIDYTTKKLHKHAVPDFEKVEINIGNTEPVPGPSSASAQLHIRPPLSDVSNKITMQPKEVQINIGVMELVPRTSSESTQPPALGDVTNNITKNPKEEYFSLSTTEKKKLNNCSLKQKALYMKCRRNMKQLSPLKNKVNKLKKESYLTVLSENSCIKDLLSSKMTATFALLLQSQLKNCKVKPRGRRWTLDEKIIALRLYKRSPACYRLLRRMVHLPAQTTLKSLLRHLPLNVGININIFKLLTKYMDSQKPEDRECVLLFDEMSIRKNVHYDQHQDRIVGYQDHGTQGRSSEIATHALVFMICRVRKKIKQPIAFYFSGEHVTADRLVVLIKEVLKYCFEYRIQILATICDQDGVNRRAVSMLGATVDKSYFSFAEQEIVAMFDTPHLLKSFRNLFLKYNIIYPINIGGQNGEGNAKWDHITTFHEVDSANPNFVFAPGLTKAHLNPNTKQKMKVKFAAQIFSHTVAAGMFAKISQGELPLDATATANIISNMDKLFDAVNADTPDLKRGKPYLTNLTNRTPHLEHFKKMKNIFKVAKFNGAKNRPPSLDGWIHTLNGIEKIWRILVHKYPHIRSLFTRRLQQDALENCFGCIRANCGSNSNPTTVQFVGGLKTAILGNLSNTSSNMNCEVDDTQIIDDFKSLLDYSCRSPSKSGGIHQLQDTLKIDVPERDEPLDICSELQACAYVCGFIVKKIITNCATCKSLILTEDRDIIHTFIQMKEYNENKESLCYVSNNLIKCVENCATTINAFLENEAHSDNIFQKIFNA